MPEAVRLVEVSAIPRTTKSVPVDDPVALLKKFSKLERVCEEHRGIGLAAVQVGWDDKMFIVKTPSTAVRYFLNATYAPVGESRFTSCEGCLSLPGRMFLVLRFKTVRVTGKELLVDKGLEVIDVDFEESDHLYSAVYQHEIDHCQGVMIDEIGQEIKLRPVT